MNQFRSKLEQLKGRRDTIQESLDQDRQTLITAKIEYKRWERAREIIRLVGIKTQERLQYHISNITSLALETVFDYPYRIKVEFIQRRNQTEADIFFVRDDILFDPISATGGGAVDIAALGLRIACWSMMLPRSRNTLILDEPFSHLKGVEANKRAIQMIKEISEKIGLQIIMVSDERASMDEIENGADKVFHVSLKNNLSVVLEK